MPRKYPRDNISENFMAAEQTGSSLREERVLDGHLRNWKTASAKEIPQRISWLRSRQEVLCEKKGYWMGTCGTGIGGQNGKKRWIPGRDAGEHE